MIFAMAADGVPTTDDGVADGVADEATDEVTDGVAEFDSVRRGEGVPKTADCLVSFVVAPADVDAPNDDAVKEDNDDVAGE